MKIKWSGVGMVDGRGKINGSVASKNRAGAYVRTKVTPVNPRSVAQQNIRSIFSQVSEYWRGMTEVQRNSWNEATENWQRTDIFGDLTKPSGFNLFMRLATPLQHTFDDVIINNYAPTPVAMPAIRSLSSVAVHADVPIVTSLGLSGAVSAGGVNLEEYAIQVYATGPLSKGVSFVNNRLRYIGYIEFAAFTAGADVLDKYIAKFGAINVADNVVFELRVIARATGQVSKGSTSKVMYEAE